MPKFTWNEHSLVVVREDGDPKFYGNAKGESLFLHWNTTGKAILRLTALEPTSKASAKV